jgi:hypothetical protein
LDALKAVTIIDDEVIPGVLAEREEYVVPSRVKRCHDCERRAIADDLRMLHAPIMPGAVDGPCPKLTTRGIATMSRAPE